MLIMLFLDLGVGYVFIKLYTYGHFSVLCYDKELKLKGSTKRQPTMPVSLLSPNSGLRPASMVVLHRSLAPAFEKFCQANNGPLPLLGLTEPGKWTLPTPNTVLDTR